MSNSPLINGTVLDPSCSPDRKIGNREYKIRKITIHHNGVAAPCTGTAIAKGLAAKSGGSANYCIGYQGDIILSVPEEKRAWTSSNRYNDAEAVTIEVSNIKGEPNWEVSDISYQRLIDLCVDICRRNGMPGLVWTGKSDGTLTTHNMFAATKCPGPYLYSKMPEIAAEVTRRVQELSNEPAASDIQKPTAPVEEKPEKPHAITNTTSDGYSPALYFEEGHRKGTTLTVTARSGLNCRVNAGKSNANKIITTFPKGTKVQWYGYFNKDSNGIRWLLVKGPKHTGYCMENFLK